MTNRLPSEPFRNGRFPGTNGKHPVVSLSDDWIQNLTTDPEIDEALVQACQAQGVVMAPSLFRLASFLVGVAMNALRPTH